MLLHVLQERLLALSRRARRALEKELQASHQQRTSGTAALHTRGTAAQPRGEQGMASDGPRADCRAGQGEPTHARQKELSDRALRILEDLSALGRQVSSNLNLCFKKGVEDNLVPMEVAFATAAGLLSVVSLWQGSSCVLAVKVILTQGQ